MRAFIFLSIMAMLLYNDIIAQHLSAISMGQLVPDVELNGIVNSKAENVQSVNGAKRLSDLKGKLVILDFWATYCSTCIAGFPKLAKLQEQFGDKLQIILVNPVEDTKSVMKFLESQRVKRKGVSVIPDNLVTLTNASEFGQLFPHRGATGYHVWIDAHRKLVLRGIYQNTHATKIASLLSGKEISFVTDNANKYDKSKPYFELKRPAQYSFVMSAFDDQNADPYGTGGDDIVDSTEKTIRQTILNHPPDFLYRYTSKYTIPKDESMVYGDRLLIDYPQKSLVTRDKKYGIKLDDEAYRRNGYCAELVTPQHVSDSVRLELFRNGINNYFINNLSLTGDIETRKVPAVRISIGDSVKLRAKRNQTGIPDQVEGSGEMLNVYRGLTVAKIFGKSGYFFTQTFEFNTPLILVDSSDSFLIDVKIPYIDVFQNFLEFSDYLKSVGFKLTEFEYEGKFLVLKSVK